MGQSTDFASGLPEFFVTDVRAERLPGNCVRFVFLHPVEGEAAAIVVPYACWLEWRLKLGAFVLECAAGGAVGGRELIVLGH